MLALGEALLLLSSERGVSPAQFAIQAGVALPRVKCFNRIDPPTPRLRLIEIWHCLQSLNLRLVDVVTRAVTQPDNAARLTAVIEQCRAEGDTHVSEMGEGR